MASKASKTQANGSRWNGGLANVLAKDPEFPTDNLFTFRFGCMAVRRADETIEASYPEKVRAELALTVLQARGWEVVTPLHFDMYYTCHTFVVRDFVPIPETPLTPVSVRGPVSRFLHKREAGRARKPHDVLAGFAATCTDGIVEIEQVDVATFKVYCLHKTDTRRAKVLLRSHGFKVQNVLGLREVGRRRDWYVTATVAR